MKEEMIHRLPTATPICQRTTPKHENIQSKNAIMSCCPTRKKKKKKCHPFRNLYIPNVLPRENRVRAATSILLTYKLNNILFLL